MSITGNSTLQRVGLTYANNSLPERRGVPTKLEDPEGGDYEFDYDGLGRLDRAADPAGGSITIASLATAAGRVVTVTTAGGRVGRYELFRSPTGDVQQAYTDPNQLVVRTTRRTDGSLLTESPDGSTIEVTREPDPRFAGLVLNATKVTTKTSPRDGMVIASSRTTARTLDQPDWTNPLSLTTLTDAVTVDGRTSTTTYSRVAKDSPAPARAACGRPPSSTPTAGPPRCSSPASTPSTTPTTPRGA